MRRGARLALALLAVPLVPLAQSCEPGDPLQQLAQSRQSIEVTLITWVEAAAPPPAAAVPDAPDDADVGEAAAEPAPAPAVPGRDAHLSLLVADRGAILPLECLTLDVVFEAGEGDAAREIGRLVREIDIARLHEVGGGLDVTLRVPLPDEPVTGIGVDLHPAGPGELEALCEAGVLARGDG